MIHRWLESHRLNDKTRKCQPKSSEYIRYMNSKSESYVRHFSGSFTPTCLNICCVMECDGCCQGNRNIKLPTEKHLPHQQDCTVHIVCLSVQLLTVTPYCCMKPYKIKGSECQYMIYCTANISHIAHVHGQYRIYEAQLYARSIKTKEKSGLHAYSLYSAMQTCWWRLTADF